MGRIEIVKQFFEEGGNPGSNLSPTQVTQAFALACGYGRTDIVEFLLDRGVDIRAGENTNQTGLHWAVIGGQLDTITLLLERGAPLEAKNVYGGTAFGQATWCAINGDPSIDYVPIISTLLDAGARVEEAGFPTGNERVDNLIQRAHQQR